MKSLPRWLVLVSSSGWLTVSQGFSAMKPNDVDNLGGNNRLGDDDNGYAGRREGNRRVFVSTPSKPTVRLVQDCMTPNPMVLRTDDAVDMAIHILLDTGYNGAPVVDAETFNLVGVISAFDFLQKEETGTLLPMQGSQEELETIMRAARHICGQTVEDLMTPLAATVEPTTTMREAAEIMIRDRCHRLCVVDPSNGRLVGVLSTSDVMQDVLTTVRQALPPGYIDEDNNMDDDDDGRPRELEVVGDDSNQNNDKEVKGPKGPKPGNDPDGGPRNRREPYRPFSGPDPIP